MVTLTANVSGYLKLADGGDPTFKLARGKRYAWIVQNSSSLTAGVVAPHLGGLSGPFFPSAHDRSAAALTYDFSKSTVTSVGFEFVALADEFTLASSGFTDGDTIQFALVKISD